jgi:hypothetical protein
VHIRPLFKPAIYLDPAPTYSQTQKSPAKIDVQDALLAIRLRVFFKAQGVSEAELDVVSDESDAEKDDDDDEAMAAEIDLSTQRRVAPAFKMEASSSGGEMWLGGSIWEGGDLVCTSSTFLPSPATNIHFLAIFRPRLNEISAQQRAAPTFEMKAL